MSVKMLRPDYSNMSQKEIDIIEKQCKIADLLIYTDDILISKYFDIDSDKLLDEKIEVLTALKNGKKPSEIPNFYKVLEKYPKNNEIWD